MIDYEERKAFDLYIKDCKDPVRKAAAVKEKAKLEVYRKMKKELKPEADLAKRRSGEAIRKPKYTEKERLERELKKNEIRHLVDKGLPGYDEKPYLKRKTDLIIQLAALKASGTIRRTSDGQLIEVR